MNGLALNRDGIKQAGKEVFEFANDQALQELIGWPTRTDATNRSGSVAFAAIAKCKAPPTYAPYSSR